jgi:hypothetical protein
MDQVEAGQVGLQERGGHGDLGKTGRGRIVTNRPSGASKNLLRSTIRAPAVLGILMYFHVHSGSCAPATREFSSLATVFRGARSSWIAGFG